MPTNADFYENPILNSPYEYPSRHWELDKRGVPTGKIENSRRKPSFLVPIPRARKRLRGKGAKQAELDLSDEAGISTEEQKYLSDRIADIRSRVDQWRNIPESAWQVTPVTARLLNHWRHHKFANRRPFFCQIEAVETLIWLTEVAPHFGEGRKILESLKASNDDANPGLFRIALKLATGAGKTAVMAMIIAWQTLNAARSPNSNKFTRAFLVCTPGITIRDRLRVLKPADPHNCYSEFELVPIDMRRTMNSAEIVITNFHAFEPRETHQVLPGARNLLKGRKRGAPEPSTIELPGQMLNRVMANLLSHKRILILNDEAHHCYRRKPKTEEEEKEDVFADKDEKSEANKRDMDARIWLSGLECLLKKKPESHIVDLSATPFFLKGSGYAEGTLFPWTVSDFSLFDAIECGIVKLPRVPVDQNVTPGPDGNPDFRNLWPRISKEMPRPGKKAANFSPEKLPQLLLTAIDALYGQYKKTYDVWMDFARKIGRTTVPPCFIFVCNNTAASKLIFDYVAGYERTDGSVKIGRCELFRNYDANGALLSRPHTLLIDSTQIDSGGQVSDEFRKAAEKEIELFKRERRKRGEEGEIDASDILREVMNTVGKPGTLGENIRCVVSVSMLTEGWDANNVTHILGVRAFGTQLLCEQVVGRALRRKNYDLNENGHFDVEYADIFGVPFDFTADNKTVTPPQPPKETVVVKAITPDRDDCEITFPRLAGYTRQIPDDAPLTATFNDDARFVLSAEQIGPTDTIISGIFGKEEHVTLEELKNIRENTVVFRLTVRLLEKHFCDGDGRPMLFRFGQLKKIVSDWVANYLDCRQGTFKAQICYPNLADRACTIINRSIRLAEQGNTVAPITAILDSYNPEGSTRDVHFATTLPVNDDPAAKSKRSIRPTDPRKCHLNYAVCDSDWEDEFCFALEKEPRVLAYVRNYNLGLEIPYLKGGERHIYIPDFIVRVSRGKDRPPLNVTVEIKGYRGNDAREKKSVMDKCWIPAVNALKTYGEWQHIELTDNLTMEETFRAFIAKIPEK